MNVLCDYILNIFLMFYIFLFGPLSIFMLIDVIIHFFNEHWHFFEFVYGIPMDFCLSLLSSYLPECVAMYVYFFVFYSSMALLLFLAKYQDFLTENDLIRR
jgi:ABC-type lipoprotein release transport system permease subunit